MNSQDIATIQDWITYNYTWIITHKLLLVSVYAHIIAGSSLVAMFFKKDGKLASMLHQLVDTSKVFKVIDMLALNVVNAKKTTTLPSPAPAAK